MTTQNQPTEQQLRRGTTVSDPKILDRINWLEKAVKHIEIRGEGTINARLEWANGRPRIIISNNADSSVPETT